MSPILLLFGLGGSFWYFFLRDKNGVCAISSAHPDVQNLLNAAWASAQRGDNYNYQLSLQALGVQLNPSAIPGEMSSMAEYQAAILNRLDLCPMLQLIAHLYDTDAHYEARQVILVAMTRGVG